MLARLMLFHAPVAGVDVAGDDFRIGQSEAFPSQQAGDEVPNLERRKVRTPPVSEDDFRVGGENGVDLMMFNHENKIL